MLGCVLLLPVTSLLGVEVLLLLVLLVRPFLTVSQPVYISLDCTRSSQGMISARA